MKAWIFASALLAAPLLAQALETPAAQPGTVERDQQEALTWLDLQRSGRAASPTPQSATAAERDRAYQRYLKSYTREIPEYLLNDNSDFSTGKN